MIDKNNIPKSWEVTQVSEICFTASGGTPSTFKKEFWDGDVPWINSGELKDCPIHKASKYITQLGLESSSAKLFPKHSVVIALTGATTAKVGLLELETSTNQSVTGMFPNQFYNPKFLFYQLILLRKQILAESIGTAQPHINKKIVDETKILIPPLPEQHRIVSKIEELFTELDKGIETLKTTQQQLKVYRQAVLKWAFEGKLTNTKFESVLTGDVIKPINNVYTPTKEFLSEGKGEIPFLKVYNLNFDGTLNFKKNPTFIPKAIHEKDLKRSICLPGDVLINIVGPPLGKVSVVTNQFPEWNINQAIVMFRPNEKVSSKYLSYFLQNHVTIQWLEGTSKATVGQWNIKVSTCREIPFPLCAPIEQNKIVKEIESRLSVCDKMEETIENTLQQAEALRLSILKKAFEGKLVEQNPEDEPAAKLLEKIRAEKTNMQKMPKASNLYRKKQTNPQSDSEGVEKKP